MVITTIVVGRPVGVVVVVVLLSFHLYLYYQIVLLCLYLVCRFGMDVEVMSFVIVFVVGCQDQCIVILSLFRNYDQ